MDGLDGWRPRVHTAWGRIAGCVYAVSPYSASSRLHSTLWMHISPPSFHIHVFEVTQLDRERADPTLRPPAPSASARPNLMVTMGLGVGGGVKPGSCSRDCSGLLGNWTVKSRFAADSCPSRKIVDCRTINGKFYAKGKADS